MQTESIVRLHLHSIGLLQNESVQLVAGTPFVTVFYEDPRLSPLLLAVNLHDTVQSWSRVQPRGFFYILYYKIICLLEIVFAFSFLIKLLNLLSMKTNILLLTGMCGHKIISNS